MKVLGSTMKVLGNTFFCRVSLKTLTLNAVKARPDAPLVPPGPPAGPLWRVAPKNPTSAQPSRGGLGFAWGAWGAQFSLLGVLAPWCPLAHLLIRHKFGALFSLFYFWDIKNPPNPDPQIVVATEFPKFKPSPSRKKTRKKYGVLGQGWVDRGPPR